MTSALASARRNRTHPGRARLVSVVVAIVLASLLLAASCSNSGASSSSTDTSDGTSTEAQASGTLRPLHAVRGADARVLDDQGRQVLLRGVNLNVLGDYYQANADYPAVIPATDADWAEMESHGFDVVRLLMSWSSLEPTRGTIDQDYLRRIHDAVDQARAHDIYVVLDMHQDAYSKFSPTPSGTACPDGSKPSIGWDGAPEWATITDGADTCAAAGVRELSPAVMRAFENFYLDTDGVQTELIKTWAAVAREFASDPAVAGYDLFNEPNWGADAASSGARLGAFTQKAIEAIRSAETEAGGFSHIVFFEPVVLFPGDGTLVPSSSVTDPNVVFAPHNYNDSIQGGTIEEGFAAAAGAAADYGTTFWIGEYGWFGTPAEDAPKVAAYAAAEDQYRVGGTWWQWKQACGDPHSIGSPGGTPADELIHFNRTACPGDVNQGPIAEWLPILSRAYPRSAPGMLTKLASNPATGWLSLSGTVGDAQPGAQLDLWIPDRGDGTPTLTGAGIGTIDVRQVEGGHRVLIEVCGDYTVGYAPGQTDDGQSTTDQACEETGP
jgi:endoglycosylceramidase